MLVVEASSWAVQSSQSSALGAEKSALVGLLRKISINQAMAVRRVRYCRFICS